MKVLEPGHRYGLDLLDSNDSSDFRHILSFVKRVGPMYPGNENPPHCGTNIQEVVRALIDRLQYLDRQIPCWNNRVCIWALRIVLYALELRAAKRHGRKIRVSLRSIEHEETCLWCRHIQCGGICRLKVD